MDKSKKPHSSTVSQAFVYSYQKKDTKKLSFSEQTGTKETGDNASTLTIASEIEISSNSHHMEEIELDILTGKDGASSSTPYKSLAPKKSKSDPHPDVSNYAILEAIQTLTQKIDTLESQMCSNAATICNIAKADDLNAVLKSKNLKLMFWKIK